MLLFDQKKNTMLPFYAQLNPKEANQSIEMFKMKLNVLEDSKTSSSCLAKQNDSTEVISYSMQNWKHIHTIYI